MLMNRHNEELSRLKPSDIVQEVDDSFFEKFGSILKQASQKAALEESTPLAPLKEVEEQDGEQKAVTDVSESRSVTRDSDSGNETLLDTDSEHEDSEKLDYYVEAVGWNNSRDLLSSGKKEHLKAMSIIFIILLNSHSSSMVAVCKNRIWRQFGLIPESRSVSTEQRRLVHEHRVIIKKVMC
ncbi:hypothetical protein KGM_209168 [Danaus plexippus plexippus]|uniref:Uncharacterized protein n=1 Tax=Danaus plexippus plexippus TaxID=278856 RepID=A0A212EQB6_DANPL|nr:hypothetical protein KGM_209168 [Danaus plexippus plexippus]